jgi:hypothetical protein
MSSVGHLNFRTSFRLSVAATGVAVLARLPQICANAVMIAGTNIGFGLRRWPMLVGLGVLLAGCTPGTTINEDGSSVTHHFGYVRHILPPLDSKNPNVRLQRIETYGLAVDRGMTLGFKSNGYLYIPLEKSTGADGQGIKEACNLVVIVKNKGQLDHAIEHLKNLEGDLCVAVSP